VALIEKVIQVPFNKADDDIIKMRFWLTLTLLFGRCPEVDFVNID
jgi:hypothetical protein